MGGKSKHIPANSLFIIAKFFTKDQLEKLMNNEEFHSYLSKLELIITLMGGRCELFSNIDDS